MIKAFGVYECACRRSNFYVGGLTKRTKTVQYLTPFPLWKFTSWKWKKHVVPDGYLLFFISGSSINSSACNYLFKARRIFLYFSPCNGLFNKMLIMLLVFLHIGTYKCFRVLITDKWSFWHSLIACRTAVVGALGIAMSPGSLSAVSVPVSISQDWVLEICQFFSFTYLKYVIAYIMRGYY